MGKPAGRRRKPGLRRATQFREVARSVAQRLDDPYAKGMDHLAGGMRGPSPNRAKTYGKDG